MKHVRAVSAAVLLTLLVPAFPAFAQDADAYTVPSPELVPVIREGLREGPSIPGLVISGLGIAGGLGVTAYAFSAAYARMDRGFERDDQQARLMLAWSGVLFSSVSSMMFRHFLPARRAGTSVPQVSPSISSAE